MENKKGKIITEINASGFSYPIEKMSDVDENWEFEAQCPVCKRVHIINKNRVNVPFKCPCGQELYVGIANDLL